MIPASFEYVRADSVSAAIGLLVENPDAKLVAGGHSLIPMLKSRLAQPSLLIDISRLAEMKKIDVNESIRLGALCTHRQIFVSEALNDIVPVMRATADLIADPLVRNRGTIGGALANADPSADWPAVVIALGGELELVGPRGLRRMPARDFFLGLMTTALAADEILTAIDIPRPGPSDKSAYRKIRHPASGYAVVGLAARVALDRGRIAAATIAITGAASAPFESLATGAWLVGQFASPETIAQAASIAARDVDYLADGYATENYRRHLVVTETKRLLTGLFAEMNHVPDRTAAAVGR
jgi:carbon-monoxide dehydrogenase medium subunit